MASASRPLSSPWLPTTATPARLEADLQARGWSLWWGKDGSLKVTAPDGTHTRTHHEATTAQTLREAYAAAQEYTGAVLREAMEGRR